jgi:hypothetical protein
MVVKVSKDLDNEDISYLSKRYLIQESQVRGMNDKEWCEFLGCQIEDLPFYLFEECDDFSLYELNEYEENRPAQVVDIFKHNSFQPTLWTTPKKVAPTPKKKKSKVIKHHFEIVR